MKNFTVDFFQGWVRLGAKLSHELERNEMNFQEASDYLFGGNSRGDEEVLQQIIKGISELRQKDDSATDGFTEMLRAAAAAASGASRHPVITPVRNPGYVVFPLVSDGSRGDVWVKRLRSKGCHVDEHAKSMICSKDFGSTKGVAENFAVLQRPLLTGTPSRGNISSQALELGFRIPAAEHACLFLEKLVDSGASKGLPHRVLVMHEPIRDFEGVQRILVVRGNRLSSHPCLSRKGVIRDTRFGFLAPLAKKE